MTHSALYLHTISQALRLTELLRLENSHYIASGSVGYFTGPDGNRYRLTLEPIEPRQEWGLPITAETLPITEADLEDGR